MKILYHHRTASKDGQAVHIEELIGALRELGHEVRVVAPDIGNGDSMGEDATWVHKLKAALPKSIYELLELAYSLVASRQPHANSSPISSTNATTSSCYPAACCATNSAFRCCSK